MTRPNHDALTITVGHQMAEYDRLTTYARIIMHLPEPLISELVSVMADDPELGETYDPRPRGRFGGEPVIRQAARAVIAYQNLMTLQATPQPGEEQPAGGQQ